jgi:hypothetical protein
MFLQVCEFENFDMFFAKRQIQVQIVSEDYAFLLLRHRGNRCINKPKPLIIFALSSSRARHDGFGP